MCDIECRRRFRVIETDVAVIATDIRWIKRVVTAVSLAALAALGIDITTSF